MNNKGQLALVGMMIGIFVILFAVISISPLADVVETQLGASQLDCENASITDGAKMTCLALDLIVPYFFLTVIALAGAYMTAKWMM